MNNVNIDIAQTCAAIRLNKGLRFADGVRATRAQEQLSAAGLITYVTREQDVYTLTL